MQRHFDDELADLKKDILRMSSLAQDSIRRSIDALKALDRQQAESVIADDSRIDELELCIDERCLNLLALRQPMAVDLRFLTMAMKLTTDLERIADLSVDIAQRVLELTGKPLLKPLIDIPKLTAIAQKMTHDVIAAFIEKDEALAKDVIRMDNEADKLRNLVQQELLHDYLEKDPTTASRALPLLLIARHLERICDHATNIAEDVIYMCTAVVVKHHPEKLED